MFFHNCEKKIVPLLLVVKRLTFNNDVCENNVKMATLLC